MPPDPLVEEDEYLSEDDSDFAPDMAPVENGSEDSGSEDGAEQQPTSGKRKRENSTQLNGDAANTDDFENSGDEAIIEKGTRRQKKKDKKTTGASQGKLDDGADDNDEGGFIKTRRMRAVEKAERKSHAYAATGPVTVDVDALWAQMAAAPVIPAPESKIPPPEVNEEKENQAPSGLPQKDSNNNTQQGENTQATGDQAAEEEPPAMIKIRRTYNFAGKVETEEKHVARDSAEAKLYLASLKPEEAAEVLREAGVVEEDAEAAAADAALRRRPRKAFRSAFEPVLALEAAGAMFRRSDLELGVDARLQIRQERSLQGANKGAKKLNVVEKSRMDWAGYVDREGIQDELTLAEKSKTSLLGRQDFLARVEAKREEDTRKARLAGRG